MQKCVNAIGLFTSYASSGINFGYFIKMERFNHCILFCVYDKYKTAALLLGITLIVDLHVCS